MAGTNVRNEHPFIGRRIQRVAVAVRHRFDRDRGARGRYEYGSCHHTAIGRHRPTTEFVLDRSSITVASHHRDVTTTTNKGHQRLSRGIAVTTVMVRMACCAEPWRLFPRIYFNFLTTFISMGCQ